MTDPDPKSLERLRNRLVALTRDLVLMPSTEHDHAARRQCYEFVRNHVEGFPGITIQDHLDGGVASLVILPETEPRPDILLVAHLDVVAHADSRVYRTVLQDGRIIGPGAGDMKGALAILMVLFRRFHRAHPGVSLGLAVTTDEETGGEHGVGHLVRERGLRCNLAIVPDGGALNHITIEEKGILHLRVEANGQTAHAARPWLGDNPIPRLLAGLQRVETHFAALARTDHHWHPTCAVTRIGTENRTVNRLPAEAHACLDVRFTPPDTADTMLTTLRQLLGPDLTLRTLIAAEPTHLSPDPRFAEITTAITGQATQFVRESGGSDARFFHPHGIPVLLSRPTVGNLHAPDEWIDIDSMVSYYRICETYLAERFGVELPAEP
ncbi:M20 family metallopeptidase [Actomonas aquatica]|uniref:M20/M25/M40 family metallo-hydrolase n=1 Tax=Actomonas aquatica TaxID=2866162 RepID=A0ABZ1C3K0_9BACT|nr:M20/M25/M40 family metallo-hydrolase [Opitutus sp. WL0086]WRQ85793.1 M20/M25/M40 family metallo-hydrolase [Opitutus sp. WL0086]